MLALVVMFPRLRVRCPRLQAARAFSSATAGPVAGHLLLGLADLAAALRESSSPAASWSASPAWIFLGAWFLYQLIEANFGLFNAHANGGGVAFFAHVGGFIFGLLAARLLARAGQAAPRSSGAPRRSAGDAGADGSRIRYSQY